MSLENTIQKLEKTLDSIGHKLEHIAGVNKRLRKTFDDSTKAIDNNYRGYNTTSRVVDDYSTQVEKLGGKLGKLASFTKKTERATNVLSVITNRMSQVYSSFMGTVEKVTKNLTEFYSVVYDLGKVGAAFGQSFEYVSRGIQNLSRVTSLSKVESAAFYKTIFDGQTGLKLSEQQIENVARALTAEYGPALDHVKGALSDLMGIQRQDIRIFDKLNSSMSSEDVASYISYLQLSGRATEQQVESTLRYWRGLKKVDSAAGEYEEKVRKTLDAQQAFQKAFADLKIDWADELATVLQTVLNIVGGIVKLLADNKWLAWVAAAVVAIKTLQLALGGVIASVGAITKLLGAGSALTATAGGAGTLASAGGIGAKMAKFAPAAGVGMLAGAGVNSAAKALGASEEASSILGWTAGGASTGAMMGGPLGALIGGGIGLLAGGGYEAYKYFSGDEETGAGPATAAEDPVARIENQAKDITSRLTKQIKSGEKINLSELMELSKTDEGIGVVLKSLSQIQAETKRISEDMSAAAGGLESQVALARLIDASESNISNLRRQQVTFIAEEIEAKKSLLAVARQTLSLNANDIGARARVVEIEGHLAELESKRYETEIKALDEGLQLRKEIREAAIKPLESQLTFLKMVFASEEEITKSLRGQKQQLDLMLMSEQRRLIGINKEIEQRKANGATEADLADLIMRRSDLEASMFDIERRETETNLQIAIAGEEVRREALSKNIALREQEVSAAKSLFTVNDSTLKSADDLVKSREKDIELIESQIKNLKGIDAATFGQEAARAAAVKISEKQNELTKANVDLRLAEIQRLTLARDIQRDILNVQQSMNDALLGVQEAYFDFGPQTQKILDNLVKTQIDLISNEKNVVQNLQEQQKLRKLTNLEMQTLREAQTSLAQNESKLTELKLKSLTKTSDMQKDFYASETAAAQARLKYEQEAFFGIGATLQSRFDVIMTLEQQAIALDEKIAKLSQERARNAEDQQRIQMELNKAVAERYDKETEIVSLTRDLREGYLGALQAFAVGAGRFEKIIARQEFGTRELLGAFAAPSVPQLGAVGAGLNAAMGQFTVGGGLVPGGVGQAEYTKYLQSAFGADYAGSYARPIRKRRPGAALGAQGEIGEAIFAGGPAAAEQANMAAMATTMMDVDAMTAGGKTVPVTIPDDMAIHFSETGVSQLVKAFKEALNAQNANLLLKRGPLGGS